jgi:hypothetical protein
VADAATITIRPPAGLLPGPIPLRVIVRGAESPPLWVPLP